MKELKEVRQRAEAAIKAHKDQSPDLVEITKSLLAALTAVEAEVEKLETAGWSGDDSDDYSAGINQGQIISADWISRAIAESLKG